MTLKQFMDANTNDDALVSLVKNGQTVPFAKVSDGSVNSLSAEVQGASIHAFDVKGGSAITVSLESVVITPSAVLIGELFEVDVDDMQSGIAVSGNKITGTLKFLSGSNAITDMWGEGNFLCLQFTADDWEDFSSVKVGLNPSQGSGLVDILADPDKNGVFKITNKNTQKFVIEATSNGEVFTFNYDLSGLVCQTA